MQIRQPLVVERLRLGRRGGHLFVNLANSLSERDRALENLTRNPADAIVSFVLGEGREREHA